MLPVDVLLIWKYSIKLPKHNFSKIDELKEILQKLLISISGMDKMGPRPHNSLDDSYLILDENYNCNFDPILQQDYS